MAWGMNIPSIGIFSPTSAKRNFYETDINKFIQNKNISNFSKIEVLLDTEKYTAVKFYFNQQKEKTIILSNLNNDKNSQHTLNINGKNYSWKGAYYYK